MDPRAIKPSGSAPSDSFTMPPNNIMNIPSGLKPSNTTTTTPPNSLLYHPLTPPPSVDRQLARAQDVLEDIKRLKDGTYSSSATSFDFTLDESEYKHLQHLISKDKSIVEDKLRYDYFPYNKRFILRMPSKFHEIIISKIVSEIQLQLRSIAASKTPSAEFARQVNHEGSSTITLDPGYGQHDPDAVFQHIGTHFPGVIIEVSFSQKRKDVSRLADDYIMGSDGGIRVVIGLDVEYRNRNVATLSVWRPQFITSDDGEEKVLVTEQTVTDQVFWEENGQPNADPESGLHLELRDFANEDFVKRYQNLDDRIFISSADLYAYADGAKKRQLAIEQQSGSRQPVVRKRPRDRTPEEELNSVREKMFKDEKQRADEQAEQDDSSYNTSFGSAVHSDST